MAAPREIPGFYYDTEKKKYFKIESGHTAPPSSRWSAESVKRRKIEKQQADRSGLVAEQKKLLVRRSRVLQDPLMGGFLQREFGRPRRDHLVDCWAKGLCPKGSLDMVEPPSGTPSSSQDGPAGNLDHIVITDRDVLSDTGEAYGVMFEEHIVARYVAMDEHECLRNRSSFQTRHHIQFNPVREVTRIRQISCMAYHRPSHNLLFASRDPNPDYTSVYKLEVGTMPPIRPTIPTGGRRSNFPMNTCIAAPPEASNLLCIFGGDRGLSQLSTSVYLTPVESPQWSDAGKPADTVLSMSFLPKNPSIVLVGTRSSRISTVDLRAPAAAGSNWIRHKSAVAHVHCINEHQVLAAGPKDAMSIYDLRFSSRGRARNAPLIRFPEYRNAASIHIGLDVDAELGVVAAAAEDPAQAQDGRVYLYSLETGRRLDCPALAQVRAGRVLKSMVFQKMPRDDHSSLFLGVGQSIQKFSFGQLHDEWDGKKLKAEKRY